VRNCLTKPRGTKVKRAQSGQGLSLYSHCFLLTALLSVSRPFLVWGSRPLNPAQQMQPGFAPRPDRVKEVMGGGQPVTTADRKVGNVPGHSNSHSNSQSQHGIMLALVCWYEASTVMCQGSSSVLWGIFVCVCWPVASYCASCDCCAPA
jgi:hypothetical protein